MDGDQASHYTVLEETTKDKYLCYIKKKTETYTICVTDATDVWSSDISEDVLRQFVSGPCGRGSRCWTGRQTISLESTEDYMVKIRSSLGAGSAVLRVQAGGGAVLRTKDPNTADLGLPLARLDQLQARAEVKELLFGMAAHLAKSGKQQVHSRFVFPEFGPRALRKVGPTVPVLKRVAGDSLINPGTKKKCQAAGVAFDDAEED
ncbi:Protein PAXX [Merluccius polli]|uniref:Protein PAXX n=1 Tax=Merluccius polli TaxID=89951 RepID=A0AA47NXU1_MERPO|nr:Protein PAXX [Merluccius polli]